jgi:undecaprenyl diphosphate synthase
MTSYINYKFGSKGEKMEKNQIPKHVGIIMDGNGRWAKQQGKPRIFGHKEGAERVIDIVRASKNIGIKYLTLYAFSTENWKRSVDEVKGLMLLFEQFLKGQKKLMLKENVSLRIVGRKDGVSDRLLKIIDEIEKDTYLENPALELNIAFNYGGRPEIIDGINKLLQEGKKSICEEEFKNYLYNTYIPDPELIIRTSGEFRTSNFLLWQSAYSEYYITETLWPDFKEEQLILAIDSYVTRERRFGGAK